MIRRPTDRGVTSLSRRTPRQTGPCGVWFRPRGFVRVARGAWYRDPYGLTAERWHDGKKWTDQVRAAGADGAVEAPPSRPRPERQAVAPALDPGAWGAQPEPQPEQERPPEGSGEFPVRMREAVGEKLRL